MKAALRWLSVPRFGRLEVAAICFVANAMAEGHWGRALLFAVAGAIASVIVEAAASAE